LNWFLVAGSASVPMGASDSNSVSSAIALLPKPKMTSFSPISNGNATFTQTVTGGNGSSNVIISATGEEAVQIVVVPQYPITSNTSSAVNIPVTPEVTTWDFYTTEAEVVPQVRWVGEKIVLEKYWGPDPVTANNSFNGYPVQFSLQLGSVGVLEPINGATLGPNIATNVDNNGGSSCILTSSDTGVSNVVAGLYSKSTNA